MAHTELRTLASGGRFFEGLRWRDGAWWVSDFYRHAVYRITPDGRTTTVLEVENQPSGLGWLPDGSLVVSSMRDHRVLRLAGGVVTTYADLTEFCGGFVNDLVVDRHGHVFVGDFGNDASDPGVTRPTSLKRIDLDGSVTEAAHDLWFPNGMAITPDGGTLLVGESRGSRYSAFDLATDGTLSRRRVWADLADGAVPGQSRVSPDGCTLDAEGYLWVADAVNRRVVRLTQGGRIVETIDAPDGFGAYACMLGGDGGRTLLLAFAPTHTADADHSAAVLMVTEVDVPHVGLP